MATGTEERRSKVSEETWSIIATTLYVCSVLAFSVAVLIEGSPVDRFLQASWKLAHKLVQKGLKKIGISL